MTSVRTSYASGEGNDLSFNLTRINPVTGGFNDLVLHVVSDESGARTYVNHAVPANLALVNNALFMYAYRVCVENGIFYGARITYQYTSAGD